MVGNMWQSTITGLDWWTGPVDWIKVIFNAKNVSPPVQFTGPVHQSSPVIVDFQSMLGIGNMICVINNIL